MSCSICWTLITSITCVVFIIDGEQLLSSDCVQLVAQMSLATVEEVRIYFRRKWHRPVLKRGPEKPNFQMTSKIYQDNIKKKEKEDSGGSDTEIDDAELAEVKVIDYQEFAFDDKTPSDVSYQPHFTYGTFVFIGFQVDDGDDGVADEEDDMLNAYQEDVEAEEMEESFDDGAGIFSKLPYKLQ